MFSESERRHYNCMMIAALVLFQIAALSLGAGSRDKRVAIGSVEDPTNEDEIVEAPGPETEDTVGVGGDRHIRSQY